MFVSYPTFQPRTSPLYRRSFSTVLSLCNLSNAVIKAVIVVDVLSDTTNGCLCDTSAIFALTACVGERRVAASVMWETVNKGMIFLLNTISDYSHAFLCESVQSTQTGDENWPVETLANMIQLCTMAVRADREVTQLKPKWREGRGPGETSDAYWMRVSSAPLLLICEWAGHTRSWNLCAGRVRPVMEIMSC